MANHDTFSSPPEYDDHVAYLVAQITELRHAVAALEAVLSIHQEREVRSIERILRDLTK